MFAIDLDTLGNGFTWSLILAIGAVGMAGAIRARRRRRPPDPTAGRGGQYHTPVQCPRTALD
jgi:hypothetical protein